MKYKTFSPILTVTKNLEGNTIPNIDGQFIVTKDGGGIYYDNGMDRILASKDDTKLPLTGGGINGSLWVRDDISTNGNVYIGTSNKDTQTTVGVNSSAGEFALHSNPSSGMRGIWDAKSGDYLAYLDSSNNVYYKGGMVTSNLFIGDSYKTTESDLGVNSTAGRMYMYSNPGSNWRGIWDDVMGSYVFRINSGGTINYSGGIFQGDIEIPYKASTRGSDAPTVPVSMAVTISSVSDLSTYKTLLGTANIDGTWNHIISTRHRNGAGDGNTYGMYIRSTLNGGSGLKWQTQNGSGGGWTGEKTILDSSNWSSYTPQTYSGTSTPSSSTGKNGDIYVVYS